MTNANQTTVASAIRRAADAGCIIEITGNTTKLYPNTKVKMTKIGTVEEAELAKEFEYKWQAVDPSSLLEDLADDEEDAREDGAGKAYTNIRATGRYK